MTKIVISESYHFIIFAVLGWGDAICSRNKTDYLAGVDNARCAGAVVTTAETALFQLLQQAGTPEFKVVSGLVKDRDLE